MDKAHEEWWEARAEEAEKLYEVAVSRGCGGSLLKELKLIQYCQKLKATTTLLTSNGKELRAATSKLDRWHKHFMQVSNVSVELEESALRGGSAVVITPSHLGVAV